MTHYQMESRPWTFRDDADLSFAKDRGASVDDIAQLLGRSPAAVQYRWRLLVFDIDSLRGRPPRRAYMPWTDDWRLDVEDRNGGTVYELAELFGRSPGAIKSRLRHIRKMRKRDASNA